MNISFLLQVLVCILYCTVQYSTIHTRYNIGEEISVNTSDYQGCGIRIHVLLYGSRPTNRLKKLSIYRVINFKS